MLDAVGILYLNLVFKAVQLRIKAEWHLCVPFVALFLFNKHCLNE